MLITDETAKKVGSDVYSQFGEDGIIEYVLGRTGTFNKWCLEVGAHDGVFFSNTKRLRDNGWHAVLIEADQALIEQTREHQTEAVKVIHATVEPIGESSIDSILRDAGAPGHPDLISIDVDGIEYELWSHLIAQPRVMVIEFAYMSEETSGVDGNGQWSYRDMISLGKMKGYEPVTATETNLIFVRRDLSHRFVSTSGVVSAT